MNANGGFTYNTNHAFDKTPTAGSGASNQPAADSFTYRLAGGGTATVSLTINGLDTNDLLIGTSVADAMNGGAGNDVINGLGGNDTLDGGAGNDVIDGGSGNDLMRGGSGDDSYFVDLTGDSVIEIPGEGFDIVYAAISHALSAGASVEVLGTVNEAAVTAINLTGNELNNFVTGNAGANSLSGGSAGTDTLWGRQGDDSYFVDSDDVVVEYAGHGYDIVYARSSHILSAGFEVEVLGTVDNNAARPRST